MVDAKDGHSVINHGIVVAKWYHHDGTMVGHHVGTHCHVACVDSPIITINNLPNRGSNNSVYYGNIAVYVNGAVNQGHIRWCSQRDIHTARTRGIISIRNVMHNITKVMNRPYGYRWRRRRRHGRTVVPLVYLSYDIDGEPTSARNRIRRSKITAK
jgi:hypothetical protein